MYAKRVSFFLNPLFLNILEIKVTIFFSHVPGGIVDSTISSASLSIINNIISIEFKKLFKFTVEFFTKHYLKIQISIQKIQLNIKISLNKTYLL